MPSLTPTPPRRRKLPRVRYAKIAHHGAVGRWLGRGQIVVDSRLNNRDFMDTLIHECLHEFAPYLDEDAVNYIGHHTMRVMWREGVRRIAK